jgi:hypothetical protein
LYFNLQQRDVLYKKNIFFIDQIMLYGINIFLQFALSYIISWKCHTKQELEDYKNTAIPRDKKASRERTVKCKKEITPADK